VTDFAERAGVTGARDAIDRAKASLDEMRPTVAPEAIGDINRIDRVLEATRLRLEGADVELVAPETFSAVAASLDALH
jgi:hypothetical protein